MTANAARRATAVHLAECLSCFNPDEPRVGNRWPAVWSIGAGSFSLVFAEVIPVGLLAHLSHSVHGSIGAGGLTIVIPAVTAAVAAPLLTLSSAAIERRALLRALGLLMLVSNVGGVLYNAYGPTGPLTLAAIVAAGASSILFVKSARAVDRKAPPASSAAAAPAR